MVPKFSKKKTFKLLSPTPLLLYPFPPSSISPSPPFAFRPSVQYLLVPTSKSRHHFFLSCTLSSQILRNSSAIHLSYSFYLDSLILSHSLPSPCLCPFHSSSFCSQSFHFFTGKPVSLVVFHFPLLRVLFLYSPAFRQYLALFPSIPFSRFHSQPISLALFPHYVTWRFPVHS
jgi:hypothetical protein